MDETSPSGIWPDRTEVPFPFTSGAELLRHAHETGSALSDVMLANERARRPEPEIREGLLHIWRVMQECVDRGCTADGVLPGGLKVKRRAPTARGGLAVNVIEC